MNECESYKSDWIFNIILLPGVLSPFLLAYPQGDHIQLYGLCTVDHTGHNVNTCTDSHASFLGGLSRSASPQGPLPSVDAQRCYQWCLWPHSHVRPCPQEWFPLGNLKTKDELSRVNQEGSFDPHKWKSVPSMMLSHLLKTARVPEPMGNQHCHKESKMNIRLPWAVWLSG